MIHQDQKIQAPFTLEQVKAINYWQNHTFMHQFTCCGHDGCVRSEAVDNGLLLATTDGMVCPCGKWKQDWAHQHMTEDPYEQMPEQLVRIHKQSKIREIIKTLRDKKLTYGLFD